MSIEKFDEAKKFQERLNQAFIRRLGKIRGGPAFLAKNTGLSPGTISEWLKEEEPTTPDQNSIRRISKALEVSFEWLATGDGDMVPAASQAGSYPQGLPREVREAVQKAVQMVEDFISVIPAAKRVEDKAKKGLYVMLVADLLVAGRQEEIPDTMRNVIQDFSRPPESPGP